MLREVEVKMSMVNSVRYVVRYVEGAASCNGNDGVEVYVDPTISGNNEEEVEDQGVDGRKEGKQIKQLNNIIDPSRFTRLL